MVDTALVSIATYEAEPVEEVRTGKGLRRLVASDRLPARVQCGRCEHATLYFLN
jgi:hypothetical protein